MNDLHPLRDKENNALVRLLSNRVHGLCGYVGDISQADETCTGSIVVSTDAAKEADAPADSGCDQKPIA